MDEPHHEFAAIGKQAVSKFRHPVSQGNSCRPTLIVFQRPAQPFSTLNGAIRCTFCTRTRKQDHIPLSLVRTLGVIMRQVFSQDVTQRFRAEQDKSRYRFFFDRSHKALRDGI
jgi:hypothetical protein